MSESRETPSDAASGSQEQIQTFEELCQLYRGIMRDAVDARMDVKLRQRIDASDIVQDALMEAFMRLEEFVRRQPMPMPKWLVETAIQQLRTAIRTHVRTAKRTVNKQLSFDDSNIYPFAQQMTGDSERPEEIAEMDERLTQIADAVKSLDEADREILLFRYFNGLSNVQVASILGVSETVASKRHFRAIQRLQLEMKRQSS